MPEEKMKHYKVFKFRLEPTAEQERTLLQTAGCRRFVWNWALAECQSSYNGETGRGISRGELSRRLTILKQRPDKAWLNEANAQSLQQALVDLHQAWVAFFKGTARYPRFKSKKRDAVRFRIPQHIRVCDGFVSAHKIGRVHYRDSRPIDGSIKSATFKRNAIGRWDVMIVAEVEMPAVAAPCDSARVIGVDLGFDKYAVLSNGVEVPAPRFLRNSGRKLARAQRRWSRRQNGSNRKAKARLAAAKINYTIANRRKDFIHKLSTSLVMNYDGVCIEDLNLLAHAKSKLCGHSKSALDASWGAFRRQLTYKVGWNCRQLAVIDRWFPSSRMCHICGAVNDDLRMRDRTWTCSCGAFHDRDLNAVINIRDEGLKLIAAGHAEIQNARGPDVSLRHSKQSGMKRVPSRGVNRRECSA